MVVKHFGVQERLALCIGTACGSKGSTFCATRKGNEATERAPKRTNQPNTHTQSEHTHTKKIASQDGSEPES